MPPESPKEQRLLRRRPRLLVTDYMDKGAAPSAVPYDIDASIRSILGSGDVRQSVEQQLATSPTAWLAVTIGDLDPGDANKYVFQTHCSLGMQCFIGATASGTGDAQAVPTSPSRPAVSRPKPQPVDSFVAYLHDTCNTKGESAALDYVYAVFHPLIIKDREFDRVASILYQVSVDLLPSSVLIGLLMTTYAHKTSLDTRAAFFAKVKAKIGPLPDGAELLPYLADLE